MRLLALTLACCSCNQFYDIRDTALQDAPPPDAPFTCPSLGTSPRFAPGLHQIDLRGCSAYTISASTMRAAAMCYPFGPQDIDEGYVAEGPVDGELQQLLPNPTPAMFYNPRLTPDGARLYVSRYDGASSRTELYTRQGTTFTLTTAAPFRLGYISTMADVDGADRMLIDTGNNGWDEMANAAGQWTVVRTHMPVTFGLGTSTIYHPNLSFDGLRLIFGAADQSFVYRMWYADRDQVSDPFRPATVLSAVPWTGTLAVMTDDCARVYFADLERTFYVQQGP